MFLTRDTPTADLVALTPEVALARARAHEVTGPSRHFFAILAGAAMSGPILWLRPSWVDARLMGDGLRPFLHPGRLIFCEAPAAVDLLRAAEEALRSGLVPLVVAELPATPGLTTVRRLHLAAESEGAPLMLLLTPDPGGAPGIETRWRIAPLPGWARDGEPRWQLSRLRARAAPEQVWEMRIQGGKPRLAALPDTS